MVLIGLSAVNVGLLQIF